MSENQSFPKTIGIDARFYAKAGPGRYTKNIVEHLEKVDTQNKYIVFMRKDTFDDYQPKNPNFTKVIADYPWYSWSEQLGFLWQVLKANLDLFYVPHFNIPVLYPGKLITAIPDIIMHSYSTEAGTTLPKPYFKFKKVVYKFVVLWALIRAKKNIVPSLDVKADFMKHYPYVPESKHVLALEGIDPAFFECSLDRVQVLKKYGIEKPFLLYISSMYEHKNVPRLIDAFEILQSRYVFEGQLVMVGKPDKFAQRMQELIASKGLSEKIIMPGMQSYVEDEETVALRKEALAYVFPSLKEGFSLTPLEAQVHAIPCTISDIPVHKEIYGDSVLYFDPENVEDMAKKMNEVMTNETLRQELVQKGKKTVKKYSWDETAKITLEVFEKYL
jgi:glycosyltransferase involved in cell wall biosynthesis